MLFDRLLGGLPERFGIWDLGISLLVIGFLVLVADYSYMLYMRSKLVSIWSSYSTLFQT